MSTDAATRKAAVKRAVVLRAPTTATPPAAPSADDAGPGVGVTPEEDKPGVTAPEYRHPDRWSLTAGGSQRKDWLTGKYRWTLGERFNARKVLGMPDWLEGSLEHRTRYETFDVPWRRGQTGGEHQIPLQTVLWLEANHNRFRAGFEFWDARQFGAQPDYTLNNTMVNVANFTQLYGAWTDLNLLDSGLAFETKIGRQTLELGSRRLVARNAYRNTVSAFTGLMLRLREGHGDWQVHGFVTQPVRRLPEEKEKLLNNDWAWNEEQENVLFAGLFAETSALPLALNAEIYLYYLDEKPSRIEQPLEQRNLGSRRLVTPGFRLYQPNRKGEWNFELESVAQAGKSREDRYAPELDHAAFLQHVQFGYTFDWHWEPRVLFQYDYASGGQTATTSHSFDSLYGARRFELGPTGIWGPFARNNINAPGTRLFVIPHRDVTAFMAYRAWWMADAKALWQPARLIDPSGQAG
ncbi:MAG: alginate export family protein, partial [Methylococcaceae bacterium]|nr:alginate export family protein [Methylococcaceae bacterium]